MVLAYHVVWGAYGFWLPNDPRGSWSTYVASQSLRRFGPAAKTDVRQSVADRKHNYNIRLAAKSAMKHKEVRLTGRQALAVAHGFAFAARESQYDIHACAILPDHVHLVIGRNERLIGRIAGHLKTRARQALVAEGIWPDTSTPIWADGGWEVFLDTPQAVERSIQYVETNPTKDGLPRQKWSFVVPWVHSPSASNKLDG